jgi:hypothetical protein
MESWRGRKEGWIGRESKCTLMRRMRVRYLCGDDSEETEVDLAVTGATVGVKGGERDRDGGDPEEGRRRSQQSASLSKRLGYLTLQTGPRAALAVQFGSPKRDLDRSVMLANGCIPHLVVSASLEYQ